MESERTTCKESDKSEQPLPARENAGENSTGNNNPTSTKKRVKKKHQCSVCKNFYSKTHLPKHIQLLHSEDELHTCKICKENFTQKYYLKIHMKTHDNFECDICHKRFSRKYFMKLHKQVHSNNQFSCGKCNKTFRTKLSLRSHQITHTGIKKFLCKLCGYKTYTKQKLVTHLESHTNRHELECSLCSRVFKTRKQRIQHEKVHTGNFDHQFTCHICHKFFFKSYDLKLHIESHERAKKPQIHTCDLCGKQLLSKQSLERHKFIHSEITPFECSICDKYFRWKETLRQHIRLKHNENPRFRCQICSMAFIDTNKYEDHMNMHNGVRPYKCDYCPSTYTRRATLRNHMKLKHLVGQKKKLHECDFCGKKFLGPSGRREHMRKHTGSAPLNCKVCGKSFSLSNQLHYHMYTHTLPYVCGICKKRYSVRGNLLRHLKTHEPKNNPQTCQVGLQNIENLQGDNQGQNMYVIKHELDNDVNKGNNSTSIQHVEIKTEPNFLFNCDSRVESIQDNQNSGVPFKSDCGVSKISDPLTHQHENQVSGSVLEHLKNESNMAVDNRLANCAASNLVCSVETSSENSMNNLDSVESTDGNFEIKSERFVEQIVQQNTINIVPVISMPGTSAQGRMVDNTGTNTSLNIPGTSQQIPTRNPQNPVQTLARLDLKLLQDRLSGTASASTSGQKIEIPKAENFQKVETNHANGNGNLLVMKKVGSFKVNADDLKQILSGKSLISMIKSQPQ